MEKPREEEEVQEEEMGMKKGEEEAENAGEESKDENPLEKYMKMVLEAREKQHAQVKCTLIRVELLQNLAFITDV